MITIRIKAFASVKDICNFDEKKLSITKGTSIKDVIEKLSIEHSMLNKIMGSLLYAVNENYCPIDTKLENNDTLAIFPPVSGGWYF